MKAETVYKYRLTFRKGRQVKYIGHLDTVLAWTRVFRRAGLPLAYSQGFNPQARIQVGASLPLGYIGGRELMDVFLTAPVTEDEIMTSVGQTLPQGFGLLAVEAVEAKSASLQSLLRQADYRVTVETDVAEALLLERIAALLAADEVIQTRIRRRKEESYNLRPLLQRLALEKAADGDAVFQMRLSTGQHGNLRPEAVLQVLGVHEGWYEVERLRLIWPEDEGGGLELKNEGV